MKSSKTKKMKKRILALLLCMVMMLNGSVSALASEVTNETKALSEDTHVHGEECYTRTKVSEELRCGKEVVEGHTHGDTCYEVTNTPELSCTLEETEGHSHDDSCFETEEIQVCTLEEHEHGDGCYTTEKELTCGQEEKEAHSHGDACYTAVENKTLTCQLEEIESHTHGDECYEWSEELVCEIEAEELVPEEISEETVIVCETCQKEKCECEKEVENSLIQTLGETTVELSGAEEAFEAEKTYALQVNELEEETAKMVAAAIKDVTRTANLEVLDYQAFDITLTADEEVAQPKAEVEVKFTGAKIEEYVATEDAEVKAFHVNAEGNAEEVSLTEGENEVAITTDHFSTYVVANVKIAEPVVLTTEADGTTITLSGPISAFAEGKTYEITAAKVEAAEELEMIEEALEEVAEEQEKVIEGYQAFDIKIIEKDETGTVINENFQPLNETPVQVMFSGNKVAESVANEETETNVIHVDTATGETQDMEATATEENDVAIETTHFSIYVYVEMTDILGEITLSVEHWAEITYIPENLTAVAGETDNIFDKSNLRVNSATDLQKIYADDAIKLPNGFRGTVEELSKICISDKENNRYRLTKIYKDVAGTWKEITTNMELSEDTKIKLEYETISSNVNQPTTFFDYNVTDGYIYQGTTSYSGYVGTFTNGTKTSAENNGTQNAKRYINANEKGINASIAKNTTKKTSGVYVIGQEASGVTFVSNSDSEKHNAYKNMTNAAGKYINYGGGIARNIVSGLTSDYSDVRAGDGIYLLPNLFTNIELGSAKQVYDDYKLSFERTGDTYILDAVKNSSGDEIPSAKNLSNINLYKTKWGDSYSNNFWPMDAVGEWYDGRDPLMGQFHSGNYASNLIAPIYYSGSISCNDDSHFNAAGGSAHNWLFGMRYDFEFTIGDYVGPMNYYFRGDDDFWLFIDGVLAVDIGGIHSAAGESLNVKTFFDNHPELVKERDENGRDITKHRLTVIYTERGGTGSCCYMQFTLPNVQPLDVDTTIEYTSVSVEKKWNDAEEIGSRPASIDVQLFQDGNLFDEKTIGIANGWKYTWDSLVKYNPRTGKEYVYSIEENTVPVGYISSKSVNGNTTIITNTKIIDIPIEKIWNDQNNKYNTQSDSVQVKLFANDNVVRDSGGNEWILTLNSECDWKGTWTGVPKCSDNGPITYRVEEVHIPDNYTVAYSTPEGLNPGDDGFKFTVTNTLKVLPLKIVKQDADTGAKLAGAKFKLKSVTYPEVEYDEVATGITGIIDFGELPYGEYTLIETKAPTRYAVNNYHLHIMISEEGIKVAKHVTDQAEPEPEQYVDIATEESADDNTLVYVMEVTNEKLYVLPSTGGIGTDMFKISGLALMSGAALFLSKKKEDEEV